MNAEAIIRITGEKEEYQMNVETVQTEEVAPAERHSNSEVWFELNQPRWSVITFENCAAKNLTYDEALQKMEELKTQNVPGLCIVTNETAERINK